MADLNSMSIQALEQRIASDAMDSDARYSLAKKYHARGQLDKAIGLYQDTMRLDPTNANAQNDLGVALQQRGKRTEAEAAYRRAIALDPFSATAHLNLGLFLRSMNRAADASQEFYQARQNARGDEETRMAESASTGAKLEPQMSRT
jgi:Flp pilus assembly protein TadD